MLFICGSASVRDVEEDQGGVGLSKRSARKSLSFCRSNAGDTNKNPYAHRGLEKFYALLAEHDEKRQRIYTEMGSEEVAFVQFVYSDDPNQSKPVVVKVKTRNRGSANFAKNPINNGANNQAMLIRSSSAIVSQPERPRQEKKDEQQKKSCFLGCKECFKIGEFTIMAILILLFLAFFGRTFAVFCSCIAWFVVPSVNINGSSSSSSSKKPTTKKSSETRIRTAPSYKKIHHL